MAAGWNSHLYVTTEARQQSPRFCRIQRGHLRDGRLSVLCTATDLKATSQLGTGRLPLEEVSQERGQE